MKRRDWFIAVSAGLVGLVLVVLWLFPRIVPERPPRLLYLLEHDGVSNLWLVDPGEEIRRLTSEAAGVWDYAPLSEDGGIIYAAMDPSEEDALDLFLLAEDGRSELLLDCPAARCASAVLQPGGRLLAYERLAVDNNLDSTELWLLDLDSGESVPAPVPQDLAAAGFSTPLGRYPRWSPDGRYLASYRRDANMIVILDFAAEDPTLPTTIPANLESMAGWSPDGRQLAYTELTFAQPGPHEHEDEAGNIISHTQPSLYQHVVIAGIESQQVRDISAGLELNEGRPAWHPEGEMLAIPRTTTGTGRQIWLVPVNGSQPTQITDDPFHDHTALAWSPDGRILVFMRVPRADGAGTPTVMLYDKETGEIRSIAEGAFLPAWWP